MLAGVDDDRRDPIRLLERVVERRDLHKVGAGCGDEVDGFHKNVGSVIDRSERWQR